MTLLKFLFPLLLWAWIVSTSYSRYITPRVQAALDTVEKLADTEKDVKELHVRISAISLRIVLTVGQMYALGIWSGYCALRTIRYTHLPGVEHKWIYHVLAFFICEGVLGYIAQKETYRGILSILHSAMAMGMFVMFSLNPYMMVPIYSWLIRVMKIPGLIS